MSTEMFSTEVISVDGENVTVSVRNWGMPAGTLMVHMDDLGELIRRISGTMSVNQQAGNVESGAQMIGISM